MQRYSNTKNAFRSQIIVLLDYRFQFNIKILSEGLMITNFLLKSLEFIELLICEKMAGVIFAKTKWEEKLQRYSNTKHAFRCRILVLLDYRFQFNIKMLSEGVMITNFVSKSFEFVELLICEKLAGLFLFKQNQKKNGKGTLTPKMPFISLLYIYLTTILLQAVAWLVQF